MRASQLHFSRFQSKKDQRTTLKCKSIYQIYDIELKIMQKKKDQNSSKKFQMAEK